MGQGKDMKNACRCSGGWASSEKRYLAKQQGVSPPGDPPVIHRSPWASLSFGDPGLQIPEALEGMSAPPCGSLTSNICTCVIFSPHTCQQWPLYWVPQILPDWAFRAWLTSQKRGRRPGPLPFGYRCCLPPLPFLPHSLHLICSWELQIFSPLLEGAIRLRYGHLTIRSETAIKSKLKKKKDSWAFPSSFP